MGQDIISMRLKTGMVMEIDPCEQQYLMMIEDKLAGKPLSCRINLSEIKKAPSRVLFYNA
jgi:hypothetical protein